MVVVCCFQHLFVLGLVPECVMTRTAQSHQVVDGISVLLPPIPLDSMWWMSTAFDWHTSQGIQSVVS
jgi:hypothetical protein